MGTDMAVGAMLITPDRLAVATEIGTWTAAGWSVVGPVKSGTSNSAQVNLTPDPLPPPDVFAVKWIRSAE